MRSGSWRRGATIAAVVSVTLPLSACLGDGLHLGDTGLFYSAGSRSGLECRYGPLREEVGTTAATAVDDPSRSVQLARVLDTAGPGTGGRYLRVDADDPGFASVGCDNWIPADTINRVLAPGLDIPAGMFLIGRDVSPGRYATTAGEGCEWAILADARPDATVLTSGHGPAPQVVEIPEVDAFFESHHCAPFQPVDGS